MYLIIIKLLIPIWIIISVILLFRITALRLSGRKGYTISGLNSTLLWPLLVTTKTGRKKMKTVFMIGLMVCMVLLQACGFEVVDTGYRGVETRFGKVTGDTLDEGLHFYNPFTSDITELGVRIDKAQDSTSAYTKDVQSVTVQYAVTLFPDKTKMHLLYQNVGKNWREKLISQALTGAIKDIVGQYDSVEIVNKRKDAAFQIQEHITARLILNEWNKI